MYIINIVNIKLNVYRLRNLIHFQNLQLMLIDIDVETNVILMTALWLESLILVDT